MDSLVGVRYNFLMSYARIVKKRLAISLAQTHNMLSRTAGYRDLYNLQQSALDPDSQFCVVMSMDRWTSRLRAEVGADFDSLFPEAERQIWYRRIFAPISNSREI